MSDRWIECECPLSGVDFDLFDDQIVGPDVLVACSMCGGQHRLGDIGQFLVSDDDGIVVWPEDRWRAAVVGRTMGKPLTN